MSPAPLIGSLRLELSVVAMLGAAAAVLLWGSAAPRIVDPADLAMGPEAHLGSEVVVVGEWANSGLHANAGYMVVILQGVHHRRVACHFEDVPGADRAVLENRLNVLRKVAIRGRCDGVEEDHVVLRRCSLLD